MCSDSSKAIVSYCWNDMHRLLVNCLGHLPRNSVARLTNSLHSDIAIVVDWDIIPQKKKWFSLCYLGEIQILQINVIHFKQ